MAKRRKYEEGRLIPEAVLSAERVLLEGGCDQVELRRQATITRQVEERKARLGEGFGVPVKSLKRLAGRLTEDADAIERLSQSLLGRASMMSVAEKEKHPEFVAQTEDLPRRLRNLAVYLKGGEKAFRLAASRRALPAVAEHTLLQYVRDATGSLHFEEVAILLGCDPDNLKQRYYSFQKSNVGKKFGHLVSKEIERSKDLKRK